MERNTAPADRSADTTEALRRLAGWSLNTAIYVGYDLTVGPPLDNTRRHARQSLIEFGRAALQTAPEAAATAAESTKQLPQTILGFGMVAATQAAMVVFPSIRKSVEANNQADLSNDALEQYLADFKPPADVGLTDQDNPAVTGYEAEADVGGSIEPRPSGDVSHHRRWHGQQTAVITPLPRARRRLVAAELTQAPMA